jgi:hypothetical protein
VLIGDGDTRGGGRATFTTPFPVVWSRTRILDPRTTLSGPTIGTGAHQRRLRRRGQGCARGPQRPTHAGPVDLFHPRYSSVRKVPKTCCSCPTPYGQLLRVCKLPLVRPFLEAIAIDHALLRRLLIKKFGGKGVEAGCRAVRYARMTVGVCGADQHSAHHVADFPLVEQLEQGTSTQSVKYVVSDRLGKLQLREGTIRRPAMLRPPAMPPGLAPFELEQRTD